MVGSCNAGSGVTGAIECTPLPGIANLIVVLGLPLAYAIAARSEPAPESAVVSTVIGEMAEAAAGETNSGESAATANTHTSQRCLSAPRFWPSARPTASPYARALPARRDRTRLMLATQGSGPRRGLALPPSRAQFCSENEAVPREASAPDEQPAPAAPGAPAAPLAPPGKLSPFRIGLTSNSGLSRSQLLHRCRLSTGNRLEERRTKIRRLDQGSRLFRLGESRRAVKDSNGMRRTLFPVLVVATAMTALPALVSARRLARQREKSAIVRALTSPRALCFSYAGRRSCSPAISQGRLDLTPGSRGP